MHFKSSLIKLLAAWTQFTILYLPLTKRKRPISFIVDSKSQLLCPFNYEKEIQINFQIVMPKLSYLVLRGLLMNDELSLLYASMGQLRLANYE